MIKEAKFPDIKIVDLAMHPKVDLRIMKKEINFSADEMDFTKGDIKNVMIKPIKEVSMELKKAGHPGKLK